MTVETIGRDESWRRLRGLLKDIFEELGGGEEYLRREREEFSSASDKPQLEP